MTVTINIATISPEAAHAAVGAAVSHGKSLGINVAAVVIDSSGQMAAFLRSSGTPFHSSGIAEDKAFTAVSFKVPSDAMFGAISGNPALVAGIPSRPRIAMFGGGLPVKSGGAVIAAIGVSGGSEAQDVECAKAGLAAVAAMEG
ncbi:MAG: heme-binding protein [Alphaproteobacteria bacterium]